MNLIARALLTLGLLAILAFCVFGFLASYEYSEASGRLPWQLGYGAVGTVSLISMLLLWRFRRDAQGPRIEERTNDNSRNA